MRQNLPPLEQTPPPPKKKEKKNSLHCRPIMSLSVFVLLHKFDRRNTEWSLLVSLSRNHSTVLDCSTDFSHCLTIRPTLLNTFSTIYPIQFGTVSSSASPTFFLPLYLLHYRRSVNFLIPLQELWAGSRTTLHTKRFRRLLRTFEAIVCFLSARKLGREHCFCSRPSFRAAKNEKCFEHVRKTYGTIATLELKYNRPFYQQPYWFCSLGIP